MSKKLFTCQVSLAEPILSLNHHYFFGKKPITAMTRARFEPTTPSNSSNISKHTMACLKFQEQNATSSRLANKCHLTIG